MATYSFLDISVTLVTPTGVISLGNGSANATDGSVEVEYAESLNKLTVGADGSVMNTLTQNRSGTCKIKLLYSSPQNQALMNAFNLQSLSSSAWGNNSITIRNSKNENLVICTNVAFTKVPNLSLGQDAGQMDWEFSCGRIDSVIGTYS